MRPPICKICQKRFSPEYGISGTVQFKLTDSDVEFNKRFQQKGFVGHKVGLEWFCEKHYLPAKTIAHLTKGEAIKNID